ncbi:FkbM family methyltransferase [Rhodobacteraceae bacterium NNCM2]|nr:FkbM family methyltransferase [Coraliihabitans acroporae]
MAAAWWRRFIPFPRQKTLRKWFPGFEKRKSVHLIRQSGATIVLDVGANVGQYAQVLRDCGYDGRIVSFEPLPDAHAELTRLAAKDPGWTIAPRTAVGDAPGEITIHQYADSSLSSALAPAAGKASASAFANSREVTAPVDTLDTLAAPYLKPGDKVFLKIDVQGLEPAVIAGAQNLLSQAVGVQIELALTCIYEGESGYLEILGLLDAHGLVPAYFFHVTARRKMQAEDQMDALLLRRQTP